MCRHLAYLGPPARVTTLLFESSRALCEQARDPRHQAWGTSNPDGWGVGWYPSDGDAPRRYRTTTPMWEDAPACAELASVETSSFVAAARLASPGSPVELESSAPFAAEGRLFSLNGDVAGFRDGRGDVLRSGVSPPRLARVEGSADTGVLFAMTLDRLEQGADPVDALRDVVATVRAVTKGRLNLLLHDGKCLTATASGNSLFVGRIPDAVVVASEPIDDECGWERVPDGSVVSVTRSSSDNGSPLVRLTEL